MGGMTPDELAATLDRYAQELEGAGYAPEVVVGDDWEPTLREAAATLRELTGRLVATPSCGVL